MPRKKLILPGEGMLRQSSINLYLQCPYAYYLEHIVGVRARYALPLARGSAAHTALEENYRAKKQTGDNLRTEIVLEVFNDDFSSRVPGIEEWGDQDEKTTRTRVGNALKSYMKGRAKKLMPATDRESIEVRFEGKVGGVPMHGTADLLTDDGQIDDHKFRKSAKGQDEADFGIQLGVYAILSGIRKCSITNVVVGADKPKKWVVPRETIRTEKSLRMTENVVRRVAESISKGSFPMCDPTHWKCQKKYCGVHHACPQGGGA